jgi:hypothetical protein
VRQLLPEQGPQPRLPPPLLLPPRREKGKNNRRKNDFMLKTRIDDAGFFIPGIDKTSKPGEH